MAVEHKLAELNIMTPAWQNFCSATWPDSTVDITLKNVNQLLKEYNAYCRDLGEWRVFFANEPALAFFVLRWA